MNQRQVMHIPTRQRGSVSVVLFSPPAKDPVSEEYWNLFHQTLDSVSQRILLDLSEVKRVLDDYWLGQLVNAYQRVLDREGVLKLLHPSANMLELLDMTQLTRVFEVFDNEDEAIESFG